MCNQVVKAVCILLLACASVYVSKTTFAKAFIASGENKSERQSPIRLTLQTSKREYRVGESVEVLGYLENRGDRPYYVGNTLAGFWGTVGLHEMRLRIFESNGKEVLIGGGGGSWIWKPNTTAAEKIAQAYTQLRPDTIWGLKETIPVKLRAGRYRLTATYREIEAVSWTEAERKALTIPVWTHSLTSNTVVITVSP
jgi:hypothetical protein